MTTVADTDLAFAGPSVLAAGVRRGEFSPRELVELFLGRIESLNPQLNAFRVVMAEQALEEADARQGHDGPLAGVPIAVKDDVDVRGQSVTRGSRSYGPPATEDAEIVRRLRAAGAIPIGITTTPELFIFPWTATLANGITRNPYNPERTTGGSSGGSAAAVAAGLVAAATGSDGGGSIRIPAAANGLVGMKPSRGRVPFGPGGPGWLGLSVLGALARTVLDSALLLDVIHGVGPGVPDAAPPFAGSYVDAAGLAPPRLKIAVSRKLPPGLVAPVAPDQRRAWDRTAALLSDLGHEVVDRDPDYGLISLEFLQTWLRGIYEESRQVPDPAQLEDATRQMAAAGRRLVPDRRRARLLAHRAATTARILRLWDEYDVLLMPTTATTPIPAAGALGRSALAAINTAGRFAPFTSTFNVTGQPAVALPAGLSTDGLPLSVQLVGRPGAEDVLYALAGQLEQAAPWAHLRPALAVTGP